jgi:TrmH family RNA methyltransferase
MRISSPANPAIKQIRALRQRKERERSGLFFIEGIRLIAEALELGAEIETLLVAPDLLSSTFAQQLVATQQEAGGSQLEVSAAVFQSLSTREGPQGLAAVVRQCWEPLGQVRLADELCWVALAGVQDPGNLGTILRTSDAVGGAGVILLGATADPYDPVALRASMGAIFAQRLVRADFGQLVAWQQQQGYPLIGTSDAAAQDYQAVRYSVPLLLLMGSERAGLTRAQQAACDALVSMPMRGRSDSLNLAVATGVMLYELLSQQRHSGARGGSAE